MGLAWIENPRVDGSIPSQATSLKAPSRDGWGFFIFVSYLGKPGIGLPASLFTKPDSLASTATKFGPDVKLFKWYLKSENMTP